MSAARSLAIQQGMRSYTTGAPCKRGHLSARTVLNGSCMTCNNQQGRSHRAKHPEIYTGAVERQRQIKKRLKNPAAALLYIAKFRAKVKGLEFSITAADIAFPPACPCCGILLEVKANPGRGAGRNRSPSVDRIDNLLGYVPGNVAVICFRCNSLKNNATARELRAVADWMDKNSNKPKET